MLKLALVAAVLVHVVASNVVDINVDVTVNGDKVPIAPEKTPPKGVEEVKHPADKGPGAGCANCCGVQCCSPNTCRVCIPVPVYTIKGSNIKSIPLSI